MLATIMFFLDSHDFIHPAMITLVPARLVAYHFFDGIVYLIKPGQTFVNSSMMREIFDFEIALFSITLLIATDFSEFRLIVSQSSERSRELLPRLASDCREPWWRNIFYFSACFAHSLTHPFYTCQIAFVY